MSPPKKKIDGRKTRQKRVKKDINSPLEVRQRMASPEMTKKRLEGLAKWRAANPHLVGRRKGHPDGIALRDWLPIQAKARETAEKAIRIMAEKDIWVADNETSNKAMKAAIEVMEATNGTTDNRLKAAKLILDFTQTKPVVKNETTLKTAEEFLSSLIEDEKNGDKA